MFCARGLELRRIVPAGIDTVNGPTVLEVFLTLSLIESPLLPPVPVKLYSTKPLSLAAWRVRGPEGFAPA
jgi:hypothetical protein